MKGAAALLPALALLGAAPPPVAERDAARAREKALAAAAAAASTAAVRARADEAALVERVAAAAIVRADAERAATLATARAHILRRALADRQRPVAALTGAIGAMARRPAAYSVLAPGSLDDQIRLCAVLATMRPVIAIRSAALRRDNAAAAVAEARARIALDRADRAGRALDRDRRALAAVATRLDGRAAAARSGALAAGDRVLALDEAILADSGTARRSARDAATLAALGTLPAPPARPGSLSGAPPSPMSLVLPAAVRVVRGFAERTPAGAPAADLLLSLPPGTPIRAPAAGRVAWAGRFRGYGGLVILDHGDGWTSILSGLEATGVPTGRQIAAGTPVGRAAAGRPLGLEVRRHGRTVDPAPLVSLR